jgi:hypothetical protein
MDLLARLHVDEPQYRYTVSGSQKPVLSGRLSSDRRILPVYRPLVSDPTGRVGHCGSAGVLMTTASAS